jgi:hypothetical protein
LPITPASSASKSKTHIYTLAEDLELADVKSEALKKTFAQRETNEK